MMRDRDDFTAHEAFAMDECRKRMEEVQGKSLMTDLVKGLRNSGDDSALLIQSEHIHIAELALIVIYDLSEEKAYGIKLEVAPLAVHVQCTTRSMYDRRSWTWSDVYTVRRLSPEEQLREALSRRNRMRIPDTFLIQPQHLHEVVTVVF
ncbi:hypothetical protein A3B45_00885 [Candidatus Daviesbacteria bacterium RIFCSPLOWO2_01_FULL_39_12]|uniref:Uncharacterized protein n=1 Tax=Candidatus Daviesbacteria bacterium RIFCSPLOWO2_01_FULL_39_12 TaxID=1797785 RepID=A0A1F5KQQ8_9BACT|nr:MAG: hypothetical protein A3D79_00055 [Candidatus Daviesbacteria bacterium RIFCSPHIGHO2_02_FULL_39_8]OGE43263.1 MAG: hypothetical protein A3B45_00885 [Candidatus Daviesbacteria bacterium RIFCSPLOWO2_01_FULL_39_12]